MDIAKVSNLGWRLEMGIVVVVLVVVVVVVVVCVFFGKVLIHDLETQPFSLPSMGSTGMHPFLGPQWHWCCANLTGHRAYFGKRDFGWSEFFFWGEKEIKPGSQADHFKKK